MRIRIRIQIRIEIRAVFGSGLKLIRSTGSSEENTVVLMHADKFLNAKERMTLFEHCRITKISAQFLRSRSSIAISSNYRYN
jgi:hypothetical protein